MDENKKSSVKCGDVLHKGSLVLSFLSMLLIVALFLRMESINRKTKMNELRISNVERSIEIRSPQTTDHNDEMETSENAQNAIVARHHKNRRDVAQTQNPPAISLQQIRKEIDKKLGQVCSTTDKICQAGPLQGPPGDPGALGYPGYKGEKGAPGKSGPQGPVGPTGAQGPRGKLGPQGPQGIKGEKGKEGPIGSPGVKGDVGLIGSAGEKGSIGLKGSKGNKGSIGVQGPKGECIITPKINVFPVSLEVFVSETATFHCWVDGETSKRITWRKIGGALLTETTSKDGILRINNVQKSHVGSYVCTVYTGYGIIKTISRLRLKEPPVITNKPPSHVSVAVGLSLNLCCEATGSPPPKVQWFRADQSTDSTLAFQEKWCLKVNAVNFDSFGDYICRATNKFGMAEASTSVSSGSWTFKTIGSGRFGAIQSFTVPKSDNYLIKAWGARGGTHKYNYGYKPGTYYGGKGAYIEGKFNLTKGTVLNIVVGQRGGDSVEVKGGKSTTQTAVELGLPVEDQAGTGGGGGSFVYTTSNVLLLAAGGGGGASAGYNGVDGQLGTSGTSSAGTMPSWARKGGTGGQPGECNSKDASYHGGVGAGWYNKGCDRKGPEHGERGGSRAQGWTGGRAGRMNSGNNGGKAPGAVGGFGGGGGGSEDNGASGGGGGYSGGGSGIHHQQAGGGGGSYCSDESCSGMTGSNSNDNGSVKIIELSA